MKKIILGVLLNIFFMLLFVLLAFDIVGNDLLNWFNERFGVSLREILYTVRSPMKGADTNFLWEAVHYCLPAILLFLAIIVLILFWDRGVMRKVNTVVSINIFNKVNLHINVRWLNRVLALVLAVCMLFPLSQRVDASLSVGDYISSLKDQTTIYEDYYVDPDSVSIVPANEEKKNLIYIYLESMETTYASEAVGGHQPVNNYIPNLTEMADENINFSNSNQLGGWHTVNGTGWTMGALFGTTSGIPFTFPVDGNSMDDRKNFASGVTTLGEILDAQGYNQEFLCGSDATFAGRSEYFQQHGNYQIFDYYTAIEKGYIPEDYYVWWGYEDKYLYQIARDEVTRLASEDEPFNLTFLTVDTHHVDGYVCDLCQDEYPEQLANVVACADRQVKEFVDWCMEQPFFENTQIIITGDHPRMDNDLVADVDYYDRTIYNCFISKDEPTDVNLKNREFSALDMFPTILSFLGYDIEGDRLGLGVNLFSDQKTLMEQMGYDSFNAELSKYSEYYINQFS